MLTYVVIVIVILILNPRVPASPLGLASVLISVTSVFVVQVCHSIWYSHATNGSRLSLRVMVAVIPTLLGR